MPQTPSVKTQDYAVNDLTMGSDNRGQYEITIPDGYHFLAVGTHVVRSEAGSNGYLIETNGPIPGYPDGGGVTTLMWRFPDEVFGTSYTFNIVALVVTFYKIGLL
jgi:hypothetical protein